MKKQVSAPCFISLVEASNRSGLKVKISIFVHVLCILQVLVLREALYMLKTNT